MVKIAAAIFVATATLAASTAFAQARPEKAIEYRQGVYAIVGWNIGPMAGMMQGRIPYDKEGFAKRAANLAAVLPMAAEGFPAGSDKGLPTQAKPEIWSNPAEFKAKMDKTVDEATKLATLAKTGSLDDIKKQFGAMGAACKACHDDFKAKDKK
jgi:cytochrome c556